MSIRQLVLSVLSAAALTASGAPAAAQSVRAADSLLRAGALDRAESLYYAASRNRPGDPSARWALGKFLIARGASRVGATLLEEAIRFGGDRTAIERDLRPVYLLMGDDHLLAALMTAPATERDRAKWLIAHETRTIAPDSMVMIAFRAPLPTDTSSVGRVQIRVNGRMLDAVVTPLVRGIAISDGTASTLHLHVFVDGNSGTKSNGVLAAADTVALGALTMHNMPVTIMHLDGKEPVAIGLDLLGKFAPSFDTKLSRVVLRAGGSPAVALPGDALPTLASASDLQALRGNEWISVTRPSLVATLREHRWTFDARRGQLIIEP